MGAAQSPKKKMNFLVMYFFLALILGLKLLTPLQQVLRPLGACPCEARLCIRMSVCSQVTGFKVISLENVFFSSQWQKKETGKFIRKCWRQDELLRKRPKSRKYLILPIINKKNY